MFYFNIYLFQLRSSVCNPIVLIIRFLNMFAQPSPDIPFRCNINTCKFSFETLRVLIRSNKSLRKTNKLKL